MARRSSSSLIFDSLLLEGGLFVPAILEKAARGEHSAQSATGYHIPQGLSLTDEQGRAFRIASALWKNFELMRVRRDVPAAQATVGFAIEFLRDSLGFSDIKACSDQIELSGRAFPITAFAVSGRVPIVVAPHNLDLDSPDERFVVLGSGARRRSAYQLAQQFLNASAECTWAIVTNGRQLRLVRDADTLTRPAFLEADLELILRDQRYADFAATWRLFHATRAGESEASCVWDTWKREGQEQGEPVREGLRSGVTDALLVLGNGFLEHPDNDQLLTRLQSGELTKDAYFQQLLRLIYRCLFVFTVEERSLIHVPDVSPAAAQAREVYQQGYSFRRFRDRAIRRAGFDRHGDLWSSMQVVFRGLTNGELRLALPALGGLFAQRQCPDLDSARLDNRSLLTAMRHLRWAQISGKLAAIDYRNMGPEELGSVYECLLELVPTIDLSARHFGFVGLTETGSTDGNARKTSGSYYTPDSLVQELLDSALDPVIEQRLSASPDQPAKALLSISVVDPACGSGHFLLAAARRLAERLAEVRAIDGAVTPADYRHALREVIAHCIHGVDRNPMALELARTALWLEGYEPGQPLSFLDHHLVCGDALLGLVNFQSLAAGVPAEAFKPLAGDDKDACKAIAAINRGALRAFESRRQSPDFFRGTETASLLDELAVLEAMPETNPLEVEIKAAQYSTFLQHARNSSLAQAADLVVAAFLAPKASSAQTALCPTTQTLADLLFPRTDSGIPPNILDHARSLCHEARVLHWPLAFAGIFARGGFDCVLGNPPWERIKIQEQEFFAIRHPVIAGARNAAARQRLIGALPQGSDADRRLFQEFTVAKRFAEAGSVFMHVSGDQGGRYPLTGVGDVNTYALFAESILAITHPRGRAGYIVPTGIATDDSTKEFFRHLITSQRLASLFDFQSSPGLFGEIGHATFKFCLITIAEQQAASRVAPQFSFFLRDTAWLHREETTFALTPEDIELINPNTHTCPIFRSRADAELTKKVYHRVPVLIAEGQKGQPEVNPWGVSFSRMMDMATDSRLFLTDRAANTLPLYEAKMIHQFDHRWATYAWDAGANALETVDVTDAQKARPDFMVQPRYWVEERHVLSRLARVPRCITRAWDAHSEDALRVGFATWIASAEGNDDLAEMRGLPSVRQRIIDAGGQLFESLPVGETDWLKDNDAAEACMWQPLTADELAVLRDARSLISAARTILDQRSPRWLMGWRDITKSQNERTVIASVIPRNAVGDKFLLMFSSLSDHRLHACLLGEQNSIVHDFVARQKLGGTSLKYFTKKQLPNLPPTAYTEADIAYITPRVLELTYTSHDLKPWAVDLGHPGEPFAYDPARRAQLRAELDAYYARLYGLTRDELRYILDPADTHGPDYPSVTFLGLKRNETAAFGEYRTRRLILEAWDALEEPQTLKKTNQAKPPQVPAPIWMDRPLVLPAAARGTLTADRYRSLVVPHLLYQAGGKVSFDRFRRAYWLLTEPATLQRFATNTIGTTAKGWAKGFRDKLAKDMFIPHLKAAVSRDLHFIRVDGERWLELRRTDHVADDEHAVFDARLALLVADLWPTTEPIAPLNSQDETAIREMELVS